MYSTILLNSNNIVKDGTNSRLVYTFPQARTFKDNSLVVDGVNLFYSWFNISSKYGNNQLQYKWLNLAGNTTTDFTITIPDGFYDARGLNTYIQEVFVANKHYLVNSVTNKNIFLLELVENPAFYGIQLNAYVITQAYMTAQNWTVPAGANWTIASYLSFMPQFVINSNAFRDVIGFTAGSYPTIGHTTGQEYMAVSSYCPQFSPVNSLIMRCNLVSNNFCIPNDVLTSFHINANWGEVISFNPSNANPIQIRDGIYDRIEVTICDQSFNTINIIDPSMVIRLLIG
jgi:hypothetical protein